MRTLRFDAIGTRWHIEFDAPTASVARANEAIAQTIETFDRSFSRFHDQSWVSRIRQVPGTYPLPEDGYELLTLYRDAFTLTDGRVTPLIGTTLEEAGYDAQYSFKSRTLTPAMDFNEALAFTRTTLTTRYPVLLDFGAAGKGYLIDKVGGVLTHLGITSFVINAGGDILRNVTDGSRSTVGLENPFDLTQAVGTCELAQGSVCASAGSRRHWGGYTHIIDPQTLSSPRSVAAVWVKAETAAVADIVSTALFFVDPARLRGRFTFDYAILNQDQTMTASRGFGLYAFTGEPV